MPNVLKQMSLIKGIRLKKIYGVLARMVKAARYGIDPSIRGPGFEPGRTTELTVKTTKTAKKIFAKSNCCGRKFWMN